MKFFVATSGVNCVNAATLEVETDLAGIITGGTGRFERASGTFTVVADEVFLVGQTQNAITGNFKGTIEDPD